MTFFSGFQRPITAVACTISAAILWADIAVAADPAHGKELYETFCTQCHGLEGKGNGLNTPHLSVQPRNHTDRDEMSARTDEELAKAILQGGQAVNKSVLMPNWDGTLSEEDVTDVIAYLRQICCR